MKKLIGLIFSFTFTFLVADTMAQSGVEELQNEYLQWQTDYQGAGTHGYNIGKGICVGPDGRIFATGQVASTTQGSNMPVIALQPDGEIDWVYEYDDDGEFSMGFAIVADDNGNLYVAGESKMGETNYFTILSVDSEGDFRWIYQKASDDPSGAFDVIIAPDGHVYACGSYDIGGMYNPGEAIIVSLTTSGTERWSHIFEAPAGGFGTVNSIAADNQSNIYGTGSLDYQYLVFSMTSGGDQQWMELYQGTGTGWIDNTGNEIIVGYDGNIYSAGKYDNEGQQRDMVTMSHTPDGVLRWEDQYIGSAGAADVGHAITMTADNSIYAAGKGVEAGTGDVWVVAKYNTSGELSWIHFENPTPGINGLNSVAADDNGYVYACGWTAGGFGDGGPRFGALGLTEEGDLLFTHVLSPAGNVGTGDQVVIGPDGYAYMVGFSKEGPTSDGSFRVAAFYYEPVGVDNLAREPLTLNVYPVPANDLLHVSSEIRLQNFKLFSFSGHLLLERTITNDQAIQINVKSYPEGAYNLQLVTVDGHVFNKKFVIIR